MNPPAPVATKSDHTPPRDHSELVHAVQVALTGALALFGLWVLEGTGPLPNHVSPLRRRWRLGRRALASTAGVVLAAHLLLLSPMPSYLPYSQPIRINRVMAYAVNCDSPLFMRLANFPREILTPMHPRQSRPGYVAASALATSTVGPAMSALGLDRAYGQTDRAYLPLVLINLLVAAASVAMLGWLLARLGTPLPAAIALSGLLAVNDLTKPFYWTPHQQMFSLFVPLATILVVRWMLRSRPSWLAVSLAGLGVGVASLFYGSFIITAGAGALVLLARRWRGVLLGGLFLAASVVPPVAWMMICKKLVGSYYSHELGAYHEFIWLPEAARAGWHALAVAVSTMSIVTIRELVEVCGPMLSIILGLGILALFLRVRLAAGNAEQRAILIGAAVTIVVGIFFTWGIGIIASRLMFHIFPALIVVAGWMAARFSGRGRRAEWVVGIALSATTLALVVAELLAHGPYD
ncbi:MAG TPA: hypothetical protein VGP07_09940 [Polyangia bacterium]|jgi:4-amino-4-deoxy-L-arabinose transferase-like glycosyltransferase